MSVPEAVRKQAEENEKALNEAAAQAAAAEEQSLGTEVAAETKENMEELPGQTNDSIEASPEYQALQKELELERQRTSSLKGRIDSQLTNANEENRELKAQMQELKDQMDEVAKASAVPGPKRYLSEEQVADMGEDVLGLQESIIKGTLEEELESGQIKAHIQGLLDQSLAARQATAAPAAPVNEPLFWTAVERYYPGAEQINTSDQDWFAFLNLHDQASGVRNRDIGVHAIDVGDVVAMVDLLNAYKPAEAHVGGDRRPPIKPEKTGASAIIQESAPGNWKEAEIEAFYSDLQRGKFKGTKEEAIAMENDIMAAAQEGRIIG